MSVAQKTDDFVARWNGKPIDEDGHYGQQCWDVVARYAREEYGCPSFPTGSGGAEGLYRLYLDPIPKYFTRVSRTDLKKGDIVVWNRDFYPPFGHTALLWKREGNTLFVLEQDGSHPNRVSYIAQRAIISNISGGLRPKEAAEEMYNGQNAEYWYKDANKWHVESEKNLALAKTLQIKADGYEKDAEHWHAEAVRIQKLLDNCQGGGVELKPGTYKVK